MPAYEEAWPTPLELFDLMDAVDAQRERVILTGQEFTIEYMDNGEFLLKPVKGYAPMGRFDRGIFTEIGG